MSIDVWADSMQHAELFGKPILFTNWLIQRDTIPKGWHCYDLRGTQKTPNARITLVDQETKYHAGTVLSPSPLKHEETAARQVNGTFYLLGEELTLEQFCEEHALTCPQNNREFTLRPPMRRGYCISNKEMKQMSISLSEQLSSDIKAYLHKVFGTYISNLDERFAADIREDVIHASNFNHGDYSDDDISIAFQRVVLGRMGHPDWQIYNSYKSKPVGRITYASGEEQTFTDAQKYLDTIREELPYQATTGFRCETLSDDPAVRKAVDDILLNFAGEENPRRGCNYGLTEAGKQALREAADPDCPHTYAWFVMTDCNIPGEQIYRDLTLEEAIRTYLDSDRPEKRLGVTKDGIATVDLVRSLNGEQHFFTDHLQLDSFKRDPEIAAAVKTLRLELEQNTPQQGITMGGLS